MPNKVFLTEKTHQTEFLKLLAGSGLSFEDALKLLELMDNSGFIVVKAAPAGTRAASEGSED